MAKGSKGDVSIRKNKKRNRYETRITVGWDPVTGRQRRQLITGATKGEVRDKLKAAVRAMDEGRSPTQDRRTVAAYLDGWLTDVVPGTVADSTLDSYRFIAEHYVIPEIGAVQLVKLTPTDVRRMLDRLAARGLSANTRRLARSVLRRALRHAEVDGIVTRNVAGLVDGVKVPPPEGRTLTVEQARTLLAAVADDRLGAAWMVALMLGLRRGELLGLGWDDVDLTSARPTLTVHRSLKRITGEGVVIGETKTRGSRRTIHLPAPVVAALKAHRKRMAAERLALGPAWPDRPLGVDLIFRSPVGTAIDPANFQHEVYRTTAQVLGERWSPHELRHSAASLLIAADVPLKVISETLGHSSIRVTSDVYGHLLADAGRVAADAMTELLG